MPDIDWSSLFVPAESVIELAIRGTMVYLALFLAMRFLPRRTVGAMGPSDLLVIVLIADAVQNGMSGGYESVTEAMILAAVIFGWATFIDWLDYKFPHWHLGSAAPLPLIVNGKILHKNMKRQQITDEELMAQLRQHGQESARNVTRAVLEGDGHFSVILRHGEDPPPTPRRTMA
jgi:uncharacterized membrane protein YcaP (DUF421 family)